MVSDTKTALLNSAEKAARSRGFDGFSYADLAADVGIRKASIHHHFPTKAALSIALIQRYSDDFEHACREIDAGHSTGGAKVLALIERYRRALGEGKTLCLCVSFSTSRESLPPEALAQITSFRAIVVRWLDVKFSEGAKDGSISGVQNAFAEAAATLPLIEGAQLAARVEGRVGVFDDAVQLLQSRLK